MILFFLVLNFAISWFNAWGCGKTWAETKSAGGWAHFMNWMGAVMSASGFTWCYLVILVLVGSLIPVSDENARQTVYAISPEMLQATFELGYVVIIVPILGSGLAITINSWAHFYRTRTWGGGAIAGYNSFAQIHNMYQAASALPDIFRHLGSFFGKGDSKNKAPLMVVLLVVAAAFGGILTTRAIIMSTARRNVERLREEYDAAA